MVFIFIAKDTSGHTINAKVESVKDNKKEKSLNYLAVRDYCQKLFEFQEITIRKFKTWSDRRKHMQTRKLMQRPSLVSINCILKFSTSYNYSMIFYSPKGPNLLLVRYQIRLSLASLVATIRKVCLACVAVID